MGVEGGDGAAASTRALPNVVPGAGAADEPPSRRAASSSSSRLIMALEAAEAKARRVAAESLEAVRRAGVAGSVDTSASEDECAESGQRPDGSDLAAADVPRLLRQQELRAAKTASLRARSQELACQIDDKKQKEAEFLEQLKQLLLDGESQEESLRSQIEALEIEHRELREMSQQQDLEEAQVEAQLEEMLAYQSSSEGRVQMLMDNLVSLLSRSGLTDDGHGLLQGVLEDGKERCGTAEERLGRFQRQLKEARRENRARAQRLSDMQIATTAIHEKTCTLQNWVLERKLFPPLASASGPAEGAAHRAPAPAPSAPSGRAPAAAAPATERVALDSAVQSGCVSVQSCSPGSATAGGGGAASPGAVVRQLERAFLDSGGGGDGSPRNAVRVALSTPPGACRGRDEEVKSLPALPLFVAIPASASAPVANGTTAAAKAPSAPPEEEEEDVQDLDAMAAKAAAAATAREVAGLKEAAQRRPANPLLPMLERSLHEALTKAAFDSTVMRISGEKALYRFGADTCATMALAADGQLLAFRDGRPGQPVQEFLADVSRAAKAAQARASAAPSALAPAAPSMAAPAAAAPPWLDSVNCSSASTPIVTALQGTQPLRTVAVTHQQASGAGTPLTKVVQWPPNSRGSWGSPGVRPGGGASPFARHASDVGRLPAGPEVLRVQTARSPRTSSPVNFPTQGLSHSCSMPASRDSLGRLSPPGRTRCDPILARDPSGSPPPQAQRALTSGASLLPVRLGSPTPARGSSPVPVISLPAAPGSHSPLLTDAPPASADLLLRAWERSISPARGGLSPYSLSPHARRGDALLAAASSPRTSLPAYASQAHLATGSGSASLPQIKLGAPVSARSSLVGSLPSGGGPAAPGGLCLASTLPPSISPPRLSSRQVSMPGPMALGPGLLRTQTPPPVSAGCLGGIGASSLVPGPAGRGWVPSRASVPLVGRGSSPRGWETGR